MNEDTVQSYHYLKNYEVNMKDNSNETLRFIRNSGLKRRDFEEPSTISQGDVTVFVVAIIAILLLLSGVI